MSDDRMGPGTYLTPDEAKEFHKLFVVSMGFFVAVALVAHFLVWQWRPWLGPSQGYSTSAAAAAPATTAAKS
ncbi:light-harvesting antenna LH1, beta subunit [Sphingomonas sp. MMS24-J45]|uniref:light-harvesting antenna LH1, beta subunit n=1 Tax=Sphingomonas sp. MMS24-J45 TaxID=3238806 RepID=UPI00384BDA2B